MTLSSAPMDTTSDPEDLRLWHQMHDQAAFERLVERHQGLVVGVCRRMLHRLPHLIDDAVQATFLLLDRHAARIAHPEHLPAWLHRVATRASLRCLRDHARGRSTPLGDEECAVTDQQGQEPQWAVARPHLDAALDDLTNKERHAVVAFYLEGQSQSAIAESAGCSVAAVKMRLQSGLNRLRGGLRRRGVAVPLALLMAGLGRESAAAESASVGAGFSPTTASPAAQALARVVSLGSGGPKAALMAATGLLALGLGMGGLALVGAERNHDPETTGQTAAPPAAAVAIPEAVQPDPAPPREPNPLTDTRVTLNLSDASMDAVVQALEAQAPGLVVVDPAVLARADAIPLLSLNLRDMALLQAVNWIAMQADLRAVRQNGRLLLTARGGP